MSTIYKWKKYTVNIPEIKWNQVNVGNILGVYPVLGDRNSMPLLVNDVERIPAILDTSISGVTTERKDVIFVTQLNAATEMQPDTFYPCDGKIVFPRYSQNGYCATLIAKSSAGYWKYDSQERKAYCYASDKNTKTGYLEAELTYLSDCAKGDFIAEVTSEDKNTYPEDGIAPLNKDPEYGTVCYWYEYTGEEELPFPDGGRLELFENQEGEPVFPMTVLEGIFRRSDGKSLAAILSSITGGSSLPGADIHGIPAGGKSGQLLSKSSDANYAVGWIDPPESGGSGSSVTMDQVNEAIETATNSMVKSTVVRSIVTMTESEYNALPSKNADTLYLIKE